jgi:hypothetical protein
MKRRHVRLRALRRVSELNISFNGKTGRNVHLTRRICSAKRIQIIAEPHPNSL